MEKSADLNWLVAAIKHFFSLLIAGLTGGLIVFIAEHEINHDLTLKYIQALFGWPIVVLIIALILLIRYEDTIRDLASRILASGGLKNEPDDFNSGAR